MSAVQEISARIGRVSGCGISANIRKYYPRWLLYVVGFLLLAANTINIGVDLGIMGAVLTLLIKGPSLAYATLFALLTLLLEVFVPYKKYVFYLKWLTLVLFAYVAVVFTIHIPWMKVAKGTFWLRGVSLNAQNFTALLAVFGTTISPYLFFWQASEEAEEVRDHQDEHVLRSHPAEAPGQLRRIRIDTIVGMVFSNLIAFSIMLTTGVVLHGKGIHLIQTPAQAAEALKPLAGPYAFLLFALGIIGTGLLSIPVLAGSAAYVMGEAFRFPVSLQWAPSKVKRFYGILAACLLTGLSLNFFRFNIMQALYWTAVLNGIVCLPVMTMMMLMAMNSKVMGKLILPRGLFWMGWLTVALMTLVTVGLFVTL